MLNSANNSAVNSGADAPAVMSQNADGANNSSRGSSAPSRARIHRGRRAGVAFRAKREVAEAQRESQGMKHVAQAARIGNVGMIDYAGTDQSRLLTLVEELTRIADAKTEKELFPMKEADTRTLTDDWSNVHLWNAAIAHYIFMSSKIPNIYKQFDIVEYLTYIQMVVELRLIRQRNVPFVHPLRVNSIFTEPDAILMQSVLPAEVVNVLEALRPVYGKEGGCMFYLPYTYQYAYSLNQEGTAWTEWENVTPEFEWRDRDVPPEGRGNNRRDGFHQRTKIRILSSRVVDARDNSEQVRFHTKRLNIFKLIELRSRNLAAGRYHISANEVNQLLEYDLLNRDFNLNTNREMSVRDGLRPNYGSLLHEETALYPVVTRIFNQLSLNYFTNFNVEFWRPVIRPITVELTDNSGKLKLFATPKASDYISTPFVLDNVNGVDGLEILDSLRHRGMLAPSRWKSYLAMTIQTLRMQLETHMSGGINLGVYLKEWSDAAALG